MKIEIGGVIYTRLKSVSFPPSADLMGQSVPIDEFTADIITKDDIGIGRTAELWDDRDKLWAAYWIVYAERIDEQTLRIRAQSMLVLLDRDTLPPTMYNAEPVADVLVECFANTGAAVGVYEYELDSAFASATITGFCPEQTARTRLLWVCFAIGAYVRSSFSGKILIMPIDNTETLIPIDKTYRPLRARHPGTPEKDAGRHGEGAGCQSVHALRAHR